MPSGMHPPPGWPIRVDPIYGCHIWIGRLDRNGYGRLGNVPAHRAAWERLHGPIPPDKTPDHRCRNRACVRHLELATKSQQERAKVWRVRARATHCSNGHDMGANAYITPFGGRLCRLCDK